MCNSVEEQYRNNQEVSVMRVSHSSEPKLIATAVLKSLDCGKKVKLLSMGSAISVGAKAVGLIELFNNGSRNICYRPKIEKVEGSLSTSDKVTIVSFLIWEENSDKQTLEMQCETDKEIVMHYIPNNNALIQKDIETSAINNLTFISGIPIVRDGSTEYMYLFYRNNLSSK